MTQTNLRAQESDLFVDDNNMVALDNHLAKARHAHGQQCLHDQEYTKAYAPTIKAQTAVATFNRALFELKKHNPSHAVIALLTYELGLARDEQLIKGTNK